MTEAPKSVAEIEKSSDFRRPKPPWVFGYLGISSFLWVFGYLGISSFTLASPLEDRIDAFKKAPEQTEAAVVEILKTGIGEHRSAKAFASVQGWLNANPAESQELLFHAAAAAEYAGEWLNGSRKS